MLSGHKTVSIHSIALFAIILMIFAPAPDYDQAEHVYAVWQMARGLLSGIGYGLGFHCLPIIIRCCWLFSFYTTCTGPKI